MVWSFKVKHSEYSGVSVGRCAGAGIKGCEVVHRCRRFIVSLLRSTYFPPASGKGKRTFGTGVRVPSWLSLRVGGRSGGRGVGRRGSPRREKAAARGTNVGVGPKGDGSAPGAASTGASWRVWVTCVFWAARAARSLARGGSERGGAFFLG